MPLISALAGLLFLFSSNSNSTELIQVTVHAPMAGITASVRDMSSEELTAAELQGLQPQTRSVITAPSGGGEAYFANPGMLEIKLHPESTSQLALYRFDGLLWGKTDLDVTACERLSGPFVDHASGWVLCSTNYRRTGTFAIFSESAGHKLTDLPNEGPCSGLTPSASPPSVIVKRVWRGSRFIYSQLSKQSDVFTFVSGQIELRDSTCAHDTIQGFTKQSISTMTVRTAPDLVGSQIRLIQRETSSPTIVFERGKKDTDNRVGFTLAPVADALKELAEGRAARFIPNRSHTYQLPDTWTDSKFERSVKEKQVELIAQGWKVRKIGQTLCSVTPGMVIIDKLLVRQQYSEIACQVVIQTEPK